MNEIYNIKVSDEEPTPRQKMPEYKSVVKLEDIHMEVTNKQLDKPGE